MLGSKASLAVRAAYMKRVDPRTYAEMFGQKGGIVATYHQKELHRIFQSDLVQRKTLLDLGSGPMMWTSLVSSRRFNDIVLSDLVEGNRLELQKWLKRSEDAIDWTFRAEQVAALEGYSDIKTGATEIQDRTRSSIRKVVPCDVLVPGVLPREHMECFDVPLSAGCLESSTADHESFRSVVNNVGALVKPHGLLVLVGMGGIKIYSMGAADVPQANVTEVLLRQAVADAGFQMKVYRSKSLDDHSATPRIFAFILAARKC